MKIPKIIHIVWVGGKPLPKKIQEIIEHNKSVLGKKWEFKIWTEKDFDVKSTEFTKYWYEKKQWAFVSDYIRAYYVNKFGGFYLDTDMRLSKTLDPLLNNDHVACRTYIADNTMSIFGSVKSSKILKTYMEVINHPKLINKPPRVMSTHIHTYAIRKYYSIPDVNEDYKADGILVTKENILQIKTNEDNIAIHEHHDNWKGTSNLSISKYYDKKVKAFNGITLSQIKKWARRRDKMNKKIERLIK